MTCARRFLAAFVCRNCFRPSNSCCSSRLYCFPPPWSSFTGLSSALKPPARFLTANSHLYAWEMHTAKQRPGLAAGLLFLSGVKISGLLFLRGHASRNPWSNLVEHIQSLLRLLAPGTGGIKIDRVLVSFRCSGLNVRHIFFAAFF